MCLFGGRGGEALQGKSLGLSRGRVQLTAAVVCRRWMDGFIYLFIYLLYTSASIVCSFDGAFVYVKEKTD